MAQQHAQLLQGERPLHLRLSSYVLCLARAPDRELLKLCARFWQQWATFLSRSFPRAGGGAAPEGEYSLLTQQVIELLTQRMPRPEEVMMMENEDGEVVRVESRDTDGIALYKSIP